MYHLQITYLWAWSKALMLTSCLSLRLQSTVLPGAEVSNVKAFCGKSVEHSSNQDECSGSATFVVAPIGCFLRNLLWPMCRFYQKVPNSTKLCLFISCSTSASLGISYFQTFLSFFLTAPCELCTTHAYTALSVNTVQERTKELLQLPHKNTESHFRQSPVIAFLLWKWWWVKLKELLCFRAIFIIKTSLTAYSILTPTSIMPVVPKVIKKWFC